ncbi:MAG: RDD family protein, partial [Planctomycetes bacterium]|nr:RDD family protein [Planctomycetota bacterium]
NELVLGMRFLDVDIGMFAGLENLEAEAQRALIASLMTAQLPFYITEMITLIVYMTLMERLFGASMGKMLLRMRVVDETGGAPSFRASLLRNLMRWVDYFATLPLGLLSCLFSAERKCFGDRLAGTRVIEDRP